MNGRDTKSILLVTLALLTAASSPLNIYGEELQDARRYDGPGRGIVIGGLLQMLLDSAAVNDVLTINAKMVRDGETGGCLLS